MDCDSDDAIIDDDEIEFLADGIYTCTASIDGTDLSDDATIVVDSEGPEITVTTPERGSWTSDTSVSVTEPAAQANVAPRHARSPEQTRPVPLTAALSHVSVPVQLRLLPSKAAPMHVPVPEQARPDPPGAGPSSALRRAKTAATHAPAPEHVTE